MAQDVLELKIIVDGKEAIAVIDKAQLGVDKFNNGTKAAGTTARGTTGDLKSMQMAVGQFGWVLGDANMFLVNFRMGLMSIGNNIPMVVQYMTAARAEAQALGTTFGRSLVQSLAGPAGLMVAVNGLMFLLQALPALFEESGKEAKGFIDAIKDAYSSLIELQTEYDGLKFKVGPENIDAAIKATKKELEQITRVEKTFKTATDQARNYSGDVMPVVTNMINSLFLNTQVLVDAEQKRKDALKSQLDFLEQQKSKVLAMSVATKQLTGAGLTGVNEKEMKEREKKEKQLEADRKKTIEKRIKEFENESQQHIKLMEILGVNDNKIQLSKLQLLDKEILLRNQLKLSVTEQLREQELLTAQFVADVGGSKIQNGKNQSIHEMAVKGRFAQDVAPVAAVPKQQLPFSETTSELELMITLTEMWGDAADAATSTLASGLTESINLFGRANNVLAQFANTFIKVLLQKAVLGFVNVITGGIGGLFAGIFGGAAAPSSGGGVAPGTLANTNLASALSSTRTIKLVVQGDSVLRGGDIYQSWRTERNWREDYQ